MQPLFFLIYFGLLSSAAHCIDSSAGSRPAAPLSMRPTHKRSNALDSSSIDDRLADIVCSQVEKLNISEAIQSLIPILQIHPLDDLRAKQSQIDTAFGDVFGKFKKCQNLPKDNNAALLAHKALLIAAIQAKYNPNDLQAALKDYEIERPGAVTDVMSLLDVGPITINGQASVRIAYTFNIHRTQKKFEIGVLGPKDNSQLANPDLWIQFL